MSRDIDSAATATAAAPTGVDPRGPRFTAGVTAIIALVIVGLGLAGQTVAATVVLAGLVALFAWGTFAGVRRHPFGVFFRAVIRPRLRPPAELEDPRPPTFAQGVGLTVTVIGLVLQLVGVPTAAPIAAAAAFVAAFLNSVFGLCLGCLLYLWLVRVGVIRHRAAADAAPAS